jgi:hypothetical protein
VPVSFFFEDDFKKSKVDPASLSHVSEFLTNYDGLALARSFVRIKNQKLRRRVVSLVEEIAEDESFSKASRSD